MRRRYRQDPVTHKLYEVFSDAEPSKHNTFVQRDIEPFVSVVDGSRVTSHRELRAHNERNNVVHQSEYGNNFGKEWYAKKAKERADLYQGTTHTIAGAKNRREIDRDLANTIRRMTDE